MKFRVIFHVLFWPDVQKAGQWLETQQPGLSERLELDVAKAVNAAIERPASFRVVDKDLRRVLLRNFRYQVVFEVHNDLLLFFGVLHCSRSFRKWRKARLSHEDE